MMIRRLIAALLLISSAELRAATSYRVTTTTRDRLTRIPVVNRVIADGENRRLTVEQQDEPFTYDVLISTDGGKTITALNTPLRTWFDRAILTGSVSSPLRTRKGTAIKQSSVTVREESGAEPIAGYPVRTFVIRASFTSEDDYGGTKVKRENAMTTMLWTTDKIDGALAFPTAVFATGVGPVDAELRQKAALVSGFPLREVKTFSQAYEGGAPSVVTITTEVDDIRTVSPLPATAFVKPAGYVNQPPLMSGVAPTIIH
jgi:hypothetical protein